MTKNLFRKTFLSLLLVFLAQALLISSENTSAQGVINTGLNGNALNPFTRLNYPDGPTIPSTSEPPLPPTPYAIEMPSETHRGLAIYAAESHGVTGVEKDWIGQGAYDEDHCVVDNYPPCTGLLAPFGFHSWDSDTDGFWTPPIVPSGSGLGHINMLFTKAVQSYASGDVQIAYLWFGRALHILGDLATPAHANLDEHVDGDEYEEWLEENDLENTKAWITDNPSGDGWDMDFREIPGWDELNTDLQNELNNASLVYGGRQSGQELWSLGPLESDVVLFRLMFLMAEEADNWDSDDVPGEKYHGDLSDPVFLAEIRDILFPQLIQNSTALIDYFEYIAVENRIYLPLVVQSP
jgi:hypothetical protein